jgi:rhamnosyltransferase
MTGTLSTREHCPTISVIMRSRNDAAIIGNTLDALFAQRRRDFEVIALDNGSTDGTLDRYADHGVQPVHVPPGTYNPGRVLNLGVSLAKGRWVVFLNSDCVPASDHFLESIIAPLEKGEASAVYGRQLARADATPLVRRDHAKAFGLQKPAWQPFFSLAASAFAAEVLRARPLPEGVQYSEDLAWAVQATRDGLHIAYAPGAEVVHSHNYSLREYAKRFFEEGRADAAIFSRGERPLRPLRVFAGVGAEVARDLAACVGDRAWSAAITAPAVRATQRGAYLLGRLVGPRRKLEA